LGKRQKSIPSSTRPPLFLSRARAPKSPKHAMALTATTRRAGLGCRSARGPTSAARPTQRSVSVRAAAAAADGAASSPAPPAPDAAAPPAAAAHRRSALLALAASAAAALAPAAVPTPARADGEYATFLGYATPPTSYGGYGGNANEPRESLSLPLSLSRAPLHTPPAAAGRRARAAASAVSLSCPPPQKTMPPTPPTNKIASILRSQVHLRVPRGLEAGDAQQGREGHAGRRRARGRPRARGQGLPRVRHHPRARGRGQQDVPADRGPRVGLCQLCGRRLRAAGALLALSFLSFSSFLLGVVSRRRSVRARCKETPPPSQQRRQNKNKHALTKRPPPPRFLALLVGPKHTPQSKTKQNNNRTPSPARPT